MVFMKSWIAVHNLSVYYKSGIFKAVKITEYYNVFDINKSFFSNKKSLKVTFRVHMITSIIMMLNSGYSVVIYISFFLFFFL